LTDVGIESYGVHIPKYRLGNETTGWDSNIERAVANFDEDSVTMAVASGTSCLSGIDRNTVDGLLFATTTPPYEEKQCASIIANALDLRRDIFTADVTGVLRAGTSAMKMAMDSLQAGSASRVLVIAADTRLTAPRADIERHLGDGAVALLLADNKGAATIEGSYTISENMLDVWRSGGDSFIRSWEDRFMTEEGLERILVDALTGYASKYSLSAKDFTKVAFHSLDPRRHIALGRRMGFSQQQIQDPLYGKVGNTGAAFPLMLLVGALEEAEDEDLVLVIGYGDGADVLAFRANGNIEGLKGCTGVRRGTESKTVLANYETYARWKNVWVSDSAARRPSPPSPSVTALWRERDQNIRLYGARCTSCNKIQYPPQRVCVYCQTKDQNEPVRLSDRKGKLFTYSMDYLAGTTDVPLVIGVVNFDGGGRMLTMMTDREIEEIEVDMPVEMSFRKLRVVNGIHNYYWKSTPIRF
jgi:hydroxymethylglutaryl-CoA synthase